MVNLFALSVSTAALTVEALRTRPESQVSAGQPWRQYLYNHQDVQYHADAILGVTHLRGILDTGSFELVAFPKTCASCYKAGTYDQSASPTWSQGRLQQGHAYGSGKCLAQDGLENLTIGSFNVPSQDIWVTTECRMRSLMAGRFNAIIGVGPPGHPQYQAKQLVIKYEIQALRYVRRGRKVPSMLRRKILSLKRVENIVNRKKSMLEQFGVSTFSECVEMEPNAPGWFVWNDETREGTPGVARIPIKGSLTWAAEMTSFNMGSGDSAVQLACQDGCAALLDTGTSLIGLPDALWKKLFSSLMGVFDANPGMKDLCKGGTLEGLPDLNVVIGGQEFSFPPSAYIGTYRRRKSKARTNETADAEAEAAADLLAESHPLGSSGCKLHVMNLGNIKKTSSGALVIFGVPFFRHYYTTFALGDGTRGSRAAYVSKNNGTCVPPGETASGTGAAVSAHRRAAWEVTPREIDPIDLRGPEWLKSWDFKL